MRKKSLLFLLPILFIASCSSSPETEKFYIDQNGDFLLNEPNSYLDLPTIDANVAIKRDKANIPTTFINASFECMQCNKFESVFIATICKRGFYIETLYKAKKEDANETENENIRYEKELLELQNFYGSKREEGIDGAVPSIYTLNQQKSTLYDMYEDNDSYYKFKSYLDTRLKKTNIYHFFTFDAYSQFIEKEKNVLTFLDNPLDDNSLSFYSETLYTKAKNSGKKLCYIDISRLSETENEKFKARFSVDFLSPSLFYHQESILIEKEATKAASIVNQYYS